MASPLTDLIPGELKALWGVLCGIPVQPMPTTVGHQAVHPERGQRMWIPEIYPGGGTTFHISMGTPAEKLDCYCYLQ